MSSGQYIIHISTATGYSSYTDTRRDEAAGPEVKSTEQLVTLISAATKCQISFIISCDNVRLQVKTCQFEQH